MPFFSIIIPTYNRANLLKQLLDLFMMQNFNDFELIIIDDGGTDDTEQVVAQYSDKRIYYYKKSNGGVSSARNFGLTKAIGKYINFFDSDDLVYSNHLSEAYKFFSAHPNNQVAIFDYDWGDRERKKNKMVSNKYSDPNSAIFCHNYISTNSIFIEKGLTDKIQFNEQLSISEDWLYWIKLSSLAKFFLLNISTSHIVEHPERSLNKIDVSSIIAQKEIFINALKGDKIVMTSNNFNLNIIISHFNSLIALNAALIGKKKMTLFYFRKSLSQNFLSIINKRSLAIIKHLLITW